MKKLSNNLLGGESPQLAQVRHAKGFALIVTLTMMVLLTLLVFGLIGLSASLSRTTNHDRLAAEAQANARMALQMAIGQLQLGLGPDQKISATAGVLDEDLETSTADGVAQPFYTGVWEAEPSRLGDAPDASMRWTLDQVTYEAQKRSSFRGWLASGEAEKLKSLDYAKSGPTLASNRRVLVSEREGTSAASTPEVAVDMITKGRNGFAWWTSDNGVKAQLRGDDVDTTSQNFADIILGMRRENSDGHALLDNRLPNQNNGLDGRLIDLASVDNAVPNQQEKVSRDCIHDLTTNSELLPVDVTKGGLKKCLNLKLDWLQGQPKAVREAAGTLGLVASESAYDAPKDYRLFAWDQLRNYESISRNSGLLTMVNGRPRVKTYMQGAAAESDSNPTVRDFRFRLQPVMIKMSYLVSYSAEKIGADGAPDEYALRLFFYPMAVLWNPYNVDLVVPEFCPTIIRCPVVLKYNEGLPSAVNINLGVHRDTYTHMPFGRNMGGTYKMQDLVIPAGSTRVLYPQLSPDPKNPPRPNEELYLWAHDKEFDLGQNGNYGAYTRNLRNDGAELRGAANDPVRISAITSPNATLGIDGANTVYWGNMSGQGGTGSSSQGLLHLFNVSTHADFNVESNSPQVGFIPPNEIPTRTYQQLSQVAPQPLFMFDVYRKPADESIFPSKTNSFSVTGNPLTGAAPASASLNDKVTRWFESPFGIRFRSMNSWADLGNYCQWAPGRDDSIYFGNSYTPSGQLNVVDQEIPLTPVTSIASLQHLPVFDFKPLIESRFPTYQFAPWGISPGMCWFYWGRFNQFAQNHAIGNSYASPGIAAGQLTQTGWPFSVPYGLINNAAHLRMDRSYVANAHLWDGWFCSSIAAQDGVMITSHGQAARQTRKVAEDFVKGVKALPNDHVTFDSKLSNDEFLAAFFEANGKPKVDAYEKAAAHLRVRGGFNVNSVSEKAWAHFLSNLLSRSVLKMASVTGNERIQEVTPLASKFLISRYSLVNAPPAERLSGKARDDSYWNGAREVTAAQINELAAAIVKQVKKRGPFLSLSEFVNRKLTADSTEKNLALSGALQSALDDTSVSINQPFRADAVLLSPKVNVAGVQRSPTYAFPEAAAGPRRQGITGYVTQADILSSVGNALAPRSDTFTIRAMGEVRSENGQKVLATAWCEAVVQRGADFVESTNQPDAKPAELTATNKKFGRKFRIVSFRWLKEEEL